jgi:hypothetical protein
MIDHTPTAFMGSTACQTSVWSSQTSILCTAAMGSAVAASSNVLLTGVLGTADSIFTYDAPVITNHVPANAPLGATATITVQGTNFGSADRSATVKLASSSCTSADWISDTSILCGVPIGAGKGMATSITFLGQSGSGLGFTFDSPVITDITRANGPTTAGTTTTVSGSNFGVSDLNPDVNIGGVSCAVSQWVSTTSVTCVPNKGSGKSLAVGVVVRDLVGTLAEGYTYDAPVVSQSVLENGPTAGSAVATVIGTNFGVAGADTEAAIGTTRCLSSSFVTSTSVLCSTPPGVGVSKAVAITASGVIGAMASQFSFDAPKVNQVLPPNAATTGGSYLTVFGQNFGVGGTSPAVAVGGTQCGSSIWQSDSSVLCVALNPGVGGAKAVSVAVDVLTGCGDGIWSYDSPIIEGIEQGNSATTGGQVLTVNGRNFGIADSNPSAFIGPTACISNAWTSDSSFTCITAQGTGTSGVSALIAGQSGSAENLFTYDGPVITHLTTPNNGPTSGGFGPITLSGFNFGTSSTAPSTYIVGAGAGASVSNCTSSTWVSATSIICAYGPATTGIEMPFHAGIDNVVGTGAPVFSYDSPVLTMISPANGPTTGGAGITVKGFNFGLRKPHEDHKGHMGDADLMLPCGTVMWTSNNVVVCMSSPGKGSSSSLAIGPSSEVYAGTLMNAFSFDAPVVTYLALNNGPTVGGSLITITGMNMGTALSTTNQVDISVAGNKCSSNSFVSSSSVMCVAPAGMGRNLDVQITINSIPGVMKSSFEYDARFVSPDTGSEYVLTVGETLNVNLVAKGEDFSTQIALSSLSGTPAPKDTQYFAGHPPTLTKMTQNSKDPSARFTWAPAETGVWNACFQLINSNGVAVDTTCVVIRAIMCQHLVIAGDTKESISAKYQVAWRTIFLLNPGTMQTMDDVQPGDILNIGKTVTLSKGQTLSTLVTDFGSTWYQLALVNPRKIVGVDATSVSGAVQSSNYKSSTQFVGLQFCVVTTNVD